MEWISVKDRQPSSGIIVAIMQGRQERESDPIEDALIVILRSNWSGDDWRTMDNAEIFHLPGDRLSESEWSKTIEYWMPWDKFPFPRSMIIKE